MRIKSVDFPEQLLEAQANGSLVIFAGAGVSMGEPSNLPGFKELAANIAQNVLVKPHDEPEDRFLGRVSNRGTNVHERAREILDPPTTRPTKVHHAIVSLFEQPKSLRIVTTNFDRHFSTVLAEHNTGKDNKVYTGPALPLGDDFHGLVYLHGSVDDPSSMILTDKDFGRAYLTVGWATQFLRRLFSQYTVLFIGYRHEDVVMNYLARGLPPGTLRFALVGEDSNPEEWQFKGITPIQFPIAADPIRYAELENAMVAWSERVRWSILDHETRIKQFLSQPTPPINSEDIDYLRSAIESDVYVKFFTRYAKDLHWMKWIEGEPSFLKLFDPDAILTCQERELAAWFASGFCLQYLYQALAVVQKNGTQMNQITWTYIAQHLWTGSEVEPQVLDKWLTVLLASPEHTWNVGLASYLLEKLDPLRTSFIPLFTELTKPRAKLEPSITLTPQEKPSVRADIRLTGEYYWMRKVWQEAVKPHLDRLAPMLDPVLTGHMITANQSLRSLQGGNDEWDAVSWGRPAIEPHEQNNTYPDAMDFLIDALRDTVEARLEDRTYVDNKVLELSCFEVPVLKRLAVHIMTETTAVKANKKIQWVLRNGWLYSLSLRHEVFRLLRLSYPLATKSVQSTLVREITKGPQLNEQSDDESRRDNEIFNLLSWLHQTSPDDPRLTKALETLQSKYPNLHEREHPDLLHWHGPVTIGHQGHRLSAEDILNMEPGAVVDELIALKGSPQDIWIGGDVLQGLTKAIALSFDTVEPIVHDLDSHRDKVSNDVWKAIIWGWGQARLTPRQWNRITRFLATASVSQDPDMVRDIAYLIQKGLNPQQAQDTLIADDDLQSVEGTLNQLWLVLESWTPESSNADNTLLDEGGSQITLCWLYMLSRERKNWTTERTKLPHTYKIVFERIVQGPSYAARSGTAMMAANVSFLYELDADWTKLHVLPLFRWDGDSPRAKVIDAWTGYLVAGHLHPDLVDYFAEYYVTSASMRDELQDVRERLCIHISWIALYAVMTVDKENWLVRCLNHMSNSERVSWARHLRWEFQHAPDSVTQAAWNSWIETYWSHRIHGIPAALVEEEISEMIQWILCLAPVFPQVVAKVLATPKPSLNNGWIFHELKGFRQLIDWPNEGAQLLIYLLRCITQPYVAYQEEIREIVDSLLGKSSKDDLLSVCNELARLGYPDSGALQDEILRYYGIE